MFPFLRIFLAVDAQVVLHREGQREDPLETLHRPPQPRAVPVDSVGQRTVVAQKTIHNQQHHIQRDGHQEPDIELLASRCVRLEDDVVYLFFRRIFPLLQKNTESKPLHHRARHIDHHSPQLPPCNPHQVRKTPVFLGLPGLSVFSNLLVLLHAINLSRFKTSFCQFPFHHSPCAGTHLIHNTLHLSGRNSPAATRRTSSVVTLWYSSGSLFTQSR